MKFLKFFLGKVLVGLLLLFAFSSCTDDIFSDLSVKESITLESKIFTINSGEAMHKSLAYDTLLDDKISIPLDSLLAKLGYALDDLLDYLEEMSIKTMYFRIVDTNVAKNFDFIDSAEIRFRTSINGSETKVAHFKPEKNNLTKKTYKTLEIDLSDITDFFRANDTIYVRIYGKVDQTAIPDSVPKIDVEYGGVLGIVLRALKNQ